MLFGILGLLIGGGLGYLTAPLVGLVCGILGLGIGAFLATPSNGKFFSDLVMRAMDIVLAFPSYLLAIAIVAFLGPGLEKGMIAIGACGYPHLCSAGALGGIIGRAERIYPGSDFGW